MDPTDLVKRHPDRVTHTELVAAVDGVLAPWPEWIRPKVRDAFTAEARNGLWAHQAEALRQLADSGDVIVATGTASGKSLIFQAAALEFLASGRSGSSLHGNRRPTVLYLAPTKALAADQLRRLPPQASLRAVTVDGDNSREERDWAREHGNYVLTNPDMLHHSILPDHQRWVRLLSGLRLLVIDECHLYRGVFGAHVSHVVRRLLRLCHHYGAEPQIVLTSATVAEPGDVARRLTGRDAAVITHDASARTASTIALWEPKRISAANCDGEPVRRSANTEAADVLAELAVGGVRTLAFTRSRRGAETLATMTQERLAEVAPELVSRVATYRGGYLPEERRALEQRLRDGELLALATTNALELGVDISGLDAVVCVGFPGTRAALKQQWGRAGRGDRPCLGILIARDEPIDSYLVNHPQMLFDAPVEATVFDPQNRYVLAPHLAAAAHELALTEQDLPRFGPTARERLDELEQGGWLRRRTPGWFWTRRESASSMADLRSSGGAAVQIIDAATGRLVGTVDPSSADATVHEGAVYVHQGVTYVVDEYDAESGPALVHREDPNYFTQAASVTEVAVVSVEASRTWAHSTVALGSVDVSTQVLAYLRRSTDDFRVLDEQQLQLPVRTLSTKAVWWTVSPDALTQSGFDPANVPGAAHAAEHASIGLLPLLATCDRWDVGGLSTALHPDTGQLTVFVYDGHPGGAGFAEHGYRVAERWLRTTRDGIASCACLRGCPACVVSPKCGNDNEPLDKDRAVALLDLALSGATDA